MIYIKGSFCCSLFLMFSILASAQQANELIYKSPTAEFVDLSLQTHKDKLRFGMQDNYYINADGGYVDNAGQAYSIAEKRTIHNVISRHAFVELLKIRFQEELFSVMDRDLLATRTQNMYEKELKSYMGQQQVLTLANSLCSKTQMKRFFCNEKTEDCAIKFRESDYYGGPQSKLSWGGKGASEFQQLRAYTTFVKELFPKVQQWGNKLHEGNSAEGYFVGKVLLGKYDFKNAGYWLNIDAFYNTDFLLRWHHLQPSNSAERTLASPKGCQILLELSPEKAEELAQKHQFLFLVFEVAVSFEGIENFRANQLKTLFSLNSPKIEIFKDDNLTQKLSEIDINTMITKTRY